MNYRGILIFIAHHHGLTKKFQLKTKACLHFCHVWDLTFSSRTSLFLCCFLHLSSPFSLTQEKIDTCKFHLCTEKANISPGPVDGRVISAGQRPWSCSRCWFQVLPLRCWARMVVATLAAWLFSCHVAFQLWDCVPAWAAKLFLGLATQFSSVPAGWLGSSLLIAALHWGLHQAPRLQDFLAVSLQHSLAWPGLVELARPSPDWVW